MFITVWEFRVRARKRRAFVRAYGPAGEWVKLFRRATGYRATRLVRHPSNPLRFFTVDVWASRRAFTEAKRKFAKEYAALDARFERLTSRETHLAAFETPS